MNKWIILAYIITVLVISGLARATSSISNVTLEKVSFDSKSLSLMIAGIVKGSCGTNLETSIVDTQSTEDGPVAILLVKQQDVGSCLFSSESPNSFELLVDIKSLGLKNGIKYSLIFDNEFTTHIDPIFKVLIPNSSINQKHLMKQFLGLLQKDNFGKFFIHTTKNGIVSLRSKINLEKYINNYVLIDGLEIVQISGPGFDLTVQDPLRTIDQNKGINLYALGISTIN